MSSLIDSYTSPSFEDQSAATRSVQLWKPHRDGNGLNRVRFLPSWDRERRQRWFLVDVFRHAVPDSVPQDLKRRYRLYDIWCLRSLGEERCPICEVIFEERRAAFGNQELVKAVNRKYPQRRRSVAWIIDRRDQMAGPRLWDVPRKIVDTLVTSCRDPNGNIMDIADPLGDGVKRFGADVNFVVNGSGLNTDYTILVNRGFEFCDLHEDRDLAETWLGFVRDNPVETVLYRASDEKCRTYVEVCRRAWKGDIDAIVEMLEKADPSASEFGSLDVDAEKGVKELSEDLADEIPF